VSEIAFEVHELDAGGHTRRILAILSVFRRTCTHYTVITWLYLISGLVIGCDVEDIFFRLTTQFLATNRRQFSAGRQFIWKFRKQTPSHETRAHDLWPVSGYTQGWPRS